MIKIRRRILCLFPPDIRRVEEGTHHFGRGACNPRRGQARLPALASAAVRMTAWATMRTSCCRARSLSSSSWLVA